MPFYGLICFVQALQLYRKWVDRDFKVNHLPKDVSQDEYMHMLSTLQTSTLCPIGIKIADGEDDATNYLLCHPCKLQGADVSLFARVTKAQQISMMKVVFVVYAMFSLAFKSI